MLHVFNKRLCPPDSLFLSQWLDPSRPSFERPCCSHNYQMHICSCLNFGGAHVCFSYSAGHCGLFKSVQWTVHIHTIALLSQIKYAWERKYRQHNNSRIKQIIDMLKFIHFKLLLKSILLMSNDSNSLLINVYWYSSGIKSTTSHAPTCFAKCFF